MSCIMINRIWGLKQRYLRVNGHALFHLHWLHGVVRNGKGAKIQNENIIMSPSGFELTPGQARHSTTSK